MNNFIIKGDLCFSESLKEITTIKDGFLVCKNGICEGAFQTLPKEYANLPVKDYTNCLVIPGMIDLHLHAPQYPIRAIGMDMELMEWLNAYAFPCEARYADSDYANMTYQIFVNHMRKSATTRAVMFGTLHKDATIRLMELMEESGLISYVGKVNMDRNSPDILREEDAETSYKNTVEWLNEIEGRFLNTKPIITPRFLPSTTNELLEKLKKLEEEKNLPVQSHLSESPGEIAFVKELFPEIGFYGEGYDKYGLFGEHGKTIMAHCVYSNDEEIALMKKRNVYVATCAASNIDLASGIAPVRKYLNCGLNIGIGSDVAGSESESIFKAIAYTIQASKLYWRYVDNSCAPLTFNEAFYLATVGGGSYFGKVGTFKKGYEFDAVVIEDRALDNKMFKIEERLQQSIYLSMDYNGIIGKFVRGKEII